MTTLTPDTPLGDLARERPGATALLERLRLDYCCGGARTLAEECQRRGLDAATVIELLDALDEPGAPSLGAHDVGRASIGELCEHVVSAHHEPTRRALPRISELLDTVVRVHGRDHAELTDLRRLFSSLRAELEEHFAIEEEQLFPACTRLEAGEGELDASLVALCEDAHEEAGESLAALRELAGGYDTAQALCGTHRALLEALHGFEADLHQHVHEENNVLFPRVLELAGQAPLR